MRKYLLIHVLIISFVFLLIIPLILLILLPAVSLADADRIFKENSKAVVMVTAYDEEGNVIGHGSGFIVRQDGAVVTNYHIVGMASDIKVKAGDKILDVEGLLFKDEENDLVILKAKAKDMPVVKLGVMGKANIGEHVYIIGYPLGLENTISVGLLSWIKKIDEKREILKMTALTSPGSSGSPVFNREGEVIGVATKGVFSETRPSSTAISVKLIKDKISSKRVTAIKESGLEDYINTSRYWCKLGNSYYYAGMHKEAIESYKQVTRIEPDNTQAHFAIGLSHYSSGRHKEAIEAGKRAIKAGKQEIKIYPDYAMAHYYLGLAYLLLNDRDSALEQSKILKSLDPKRANALYNLINK